LTKALRKVRIGEERHAERHQIRRALGQQGVGARRVVASICRRRLVPRAAEKYRASSRAPSATLSAIGYSQATSIIASISGNFTPATSLANPYPSGLIQPSGNSLGGLSGIGQAVRVFSPTAQSPGYVQEYSFEVQRQLPRGFVLTVGALGSHSLHLLESGENIDQLNPP
jgi:hypothetical protein